MFRISHIVTPGTYLANLLLSSTIPLLSLQMYGPMCTDTGGHIMRGTKLSEITKLTHYSLDELKAKYKELFDQESESNNRTFLGRLIAHRLQEIKLGALSKVAKDRLNELIQRYDPINNKEFRPDAPFAKNKSGRDRRLPIAGTEIIKKYKGQQYVIKVAENSFEFNGKIYRTLSRIAEEITGVHWSGYAFFNL